MKIEAESGVNSLYVSNLYPKTGDEVKLRMKTDLNNLKVSLYTFFRDKLDCYECTLKDGYFETSVKVKGGFRYYFVLLDGFEELYLTESGVCTVPPVLDECFCLEADFAAPEWVASSTCYQIFPDRFAKGDPATGAKEGEYEFDGGSVKVLSEDDRPLPFCEGRCLDFFNGDLKGIEDKLDYLESLGITALYLNPIGESSTTHRYDCLDFFHVDRKLGGDRAFESLCDAAHKRGIKVIVDISINHTSSEHPWIKKAAEDPSSEEREFYYFDENDEPVCWEGVPTLAQLNYNSEKLKDIMYRGENSVLKHYLRPPYLQDGWRLDVAPDLGRYKEDDLCDQIWREVRDAVKGENPSTYLVSEDWLDSTDHLAGDQWDAVMNYKGCGRPIRRWMGEQDRFLASDWGTNPDDVRPYTGVEMKEALEKVLKSQKPQIRYLEMNLYDSHDTPRLAAKVNHQFPLFRGVVMLQYLLPGMPCVYYGDEVGLEGPYGSLEDARFFMQWDEKKQNQQVLELHREMGRVRNRYASLLSFGACSFPYADESVMVMARYDEQQVLLFVLNRSSEKKSFSFTEKLWNLESCSKPGIEVTGDEVKVALEPAQSELFVLKRQ